METNEFLDREAEVLKAFEAATETCYVKFEQIPGERLLHHRSDLNAFLLLDKIVGGETNMIGGTSHDKIYLNVTLEELIDSEITDVQIEDLVRSGVLYDVEENEFFMFV